ncbi:MAG: hypothetical protein IPK83_24735, partial [Planctomycetes bacterium]|nr:hypothetical protein [Planctomycetota bacterium]
MQIRTQRSSMWLLPLISMLLFLPFAMGQEEQISAGQASGVSDRAGQPAVARDATSGSTNEEGAATAETNVRGVASQTTSADANSTGAGGVTTPEEPKAKEAGRYFGLWTLTPAIVAIVLAVITQQVVPSLALGILTAAVMMCIYSGQQNPIEMVMYAVNHYLLGVFIPVDKTNLDRLDNGYGRLQVIVFTQFIGGMIGIIEANG